MKNHSLFQLLSRVYPDFAWNAELFTSPKDVWNNDQFANNFVQWLKKQNEIEISLVNKIVKNRGNKEQNILIASHKAAFPKYNWTNTLPTTSKKTQYLLKEYISSLFKNATLLQEYIHPDFSKLELDYFFPEYKLAFEYQVNTKRNLCV